MEKKVKCGFEVQSLFFIFFFLLCFWFSTNSIALTPLIKGVCLCHIDACNLTLMNIMTYVITLVDSFSRVITGVDVVSMSSLALVLLRFLMLDPDFLFFGFWFSFLWMCMIQLLCFMIAGFFSSYGADSSEVTSIWWIWGKLLFILFHHHWFGFEFCIVWINSLIQRLEHKWLSFKCLSINYFYN